jgi:hypothetical protein
MKVAHYQEIRDEGIDMAFGGKKFELMGKKSRALGQKFLMTQVPSALYSSYITDQGSPCPLVTLNPFGRELLL